MTEFEELVRKYTTLDPVLYGKCPVCGEKAMFVSFDKELWFCFECESGGNAAKFLSHAEGISYIEAVKRLPPGLKAEYTKMTEELNHPEEIRKRVHRLAALEEYVRENTEIPVEQKAGLLKSFDGLRKVYRRKLGG